ncbi:hypothetical protein PTSG_09641 [Salpingoeca rosetta]|uniref:Uncharacterized protein n=1 Tax=Salpingoeca rosetta (strain ATCC 50818 / BSB-021) TaxID=946362 RepID=F2ULK4_SALR5|nr:uncharacterized protein PTSG_09641 [Salpingoeca rosetta]EGD78003.1 hypothetical protein PTSG_09641 [Salpingoeca rosetta]|eukprot:XP_004990065.1 hypothetical protein PTSG_09641 [Salpingoeca rosetta]
MRQQQQLRQQQQQQQQQQHSPQNEMTSGGAELAIPFRILDCCALVGVDIPKQLDAGGDDWLDQPISKPAVLHCFSGDVGSASDLKVSSLLANHHPVSCMHS